MAQETEAPKTGTIGDKFSVAFATCGVGYLPLAPGTWGSIVGVAIYVAAYAAEIAAFVEAVEQGKPTPTTGEDGLRALALADAALRSVAEGRAVRVSEVLDA